MSEPVTTGTITWDASEPLVVDYSTQNPKFAFYPDTPACTEFYAAPSMWARVDANNVVTHLDMDVCAKGTDPYSALAVAVWNAALDKALQYADDCVDVESVCELLKELKK